MKIKIEFLYLLAIIICTINTTNVFGRSESTVSSVQRVDLSEGKIVGEKAGYYIEIPQKWKQNIICHREKLSDDSKMLEKLNFYYQPYNKTSKPVFMMNLFVFEKKNWDDTVNHNKLIETKDYVFTSYVATKTKFKDKSDDILFNSFIEDAASVKYIKSLIKLVDITSEDIENSIYVNGNRIEGLAIYKDDEVPYMPLREVCEAMGYEVKWLKENRGIEVSKDYFLNIVHLDNLDFNKNFGSYVIDGKTYISTFYFIQVLNTYIEVDHKGNILVAQ